LKSEVAQTWVAEQRIRGDITGVTHLGFNAVGPVASLIAEHIATRERDFGCAKKIVTFNRWSKIVSSDDYSVQFDPRAHTVHYPVLRRIVYEERVREAARL
jgi:hypothetical protein